MLDVDYVVGAYVGVLAETVLRMTEGLFSMGLVNLNQRMLTVNYKAQHIPLSDYAIELLRSFSTQTALRPRAKNRQTKIL
ncbi:MAG: hypothetical protein DMG19_00515 [Acidobacteria bacterium]|nr:MAG: hypothetical protein DMG19_00515 [Acidobacteriota bacterium]